MFKKTNDCFTHRKMQLLKFKMFEKTNHVNAFTVLNVHIFSNKKKKSDQTTSKKKLLFLNLTALTHIKNKVLKNYKNKKKKEIKFIKSLFKQSRKRTSDFFFN